MEIQTLRALIASRGYKDMKSHSGRWSLGEDLVTEAIYGERTYDREEQTDAFLTHESVTVYDLKTWMCSDTPVGLRLVELNGDPVGVTWQSARKAHESLMFISAEARKVFVETWDKHVSPDKVDLNVMDLSALMIPIAREGEKPYDLEGGDGLSFSAYAASRMFDEMQAGTASTKDPDLVRAIADKLREYAKDMDARIARNTELLGRDKPDHLTEESFTRLKADVQEQIDKAQKNKDTIEEDMLPALAETLSALENAPSP